MFMTARVKTQNETCKKSNINNYIKERLKYNFNLHRNHKDIKTDINNMRFKLSCNLRTRRKLKLLIQWLYSSEQPGLV